MASGIHASCVPQSNAVSQPQTVTEVAERCAAHPRGLLAVAKVHPCFSKSAGICNFGGREASNSVLKLGQLSHRLLLRNEDNPKITASSRTRDVKCEACQGKRRQVDYGYNLYELLGVDKDARGEEIKRAYRWLQKKCHPDIAGPPGHDMSILLNDAYGVLSDPDRRANYDATTAEDEQFSGYTGEPLYSKWYGKPKENRAVFVEESRCIGCLKCALIAPNTFSIETRYGRARAVNQWLDGEGTIKDAIRACPVDCISWVDKDLLPALEFIMSKQPRLVVGVNNSSYVGVRRENVFASARRFVEKFNKREEVLNSSSQETPGQREARMAAAEEIHMKAGRWWHDWMNRQVSSVHPATEARAQSASRSSSGALIPVSSGGRIGFRNKQFVDKTGAAKLLVEKDVDLGPLLEAARQRRRGKKGSSNAVSSENDEEYWIPTKFDRPVSSRVSAFKGKASIPIYIPPKTENPDAGVNSLHRSSGRVYYKDMKLPESVKTIKSAVPVLASFTAAVLVGLNGGFDVALSETDLGNHGPLPTSMISSGAMQMFLTAAVWYMIGTVVCEAAVFLTTAVISQKRGNDSPER